MLIDLDSLSPTQVYFTMIQTLIPRPIAWVLSANEDGGLNLAPFSYFTAVCSDPPLILISAGRRSDGSPKDTRVNIEAREHFVVMIPHREVREVMNESSLSLPAGESEVAHLGLATAPFEGSPLPRLADSRIAFACRRFQIQEIGNGPQALIFGQVDRVFVDDAIATTDAKGRLAVDPAALDPVARLGAGQYAQLADFCRLPRPA